jgi:hypothetical protein
VADQCVLLEDLLNLEGGSVREFEVRASPRPGLVCVDVRLRRGMDWYFARRWLRRGLRPHELYHWLDRLERAGYRFAVSAGPRVPPVRRDPAEAGIRASHMRAGLSAAEERLHAQLFPQEAALLACGYDWDMDAVYRDGRPLAADAYGRILDEANGMLYEWVRVLDELTWRRYPLEPMRGRRGYSRYVTR